MKPQFTLFFALILIIAIPSCTPEDDIYPDTDSREDFIGEWTVSDACSKQTYRSTISLDSENSSQVLIENFANLNITVNAVVAGNSIYLSDEQTLQSIYLVSGNGILSKNLITWEKHNYETTGDAFSCTAIYTKLSE
jgi:hypothetical protein